MTKTNVFDFLIKDYKNVPSYFEVFVVEINCKSSIMSMILHPCETCLGTIVLTLQDGHKCISPSEINSKTQSN